MTDSTRRPAPRSSAPRTSAPRTPPTATGSRGSASRAAGSRVAGPRVAAAGVTAAGIAGVLGLAACGPAEEPADRAAGPADVAPAPTAPTPSAPAPSAPSAPSAASSTAAPEAPAAPSDQRYRDGEYTASGWYGGLPSHIVVDLTLRDDLIADVEVTPTATNETSLDLQERFASAVADEVVGRPIDEVELDYLAGSSGTTQGFNDALEQIRQLAAG